MVLSNGEIVHEDDATPWCKLIFEIIHQTTPMKIFLSQHSGIPPSPQMFSVFDTKDIKYHAFCDDFGPMDFGSIAFFVERLDEEIENAETDGIVYNAEVGPRALTNAAFLLGAYAILRKDFEPSQVANCFQGLGQHFFEPYRDVTHAPADFHLQLIDCWNGIYRAKELKLLRLPSCHNSRNWGMIHLDEYLQYDDPLNGDLHEVVPGKFVAFMGPRDLGGAEYCDNIIQGARSFSPKYYIDIFRELGVSTVVRLNEPLYNSADFTSAGLQHFDLPFNDCTAPPPDVVMRFLSIAKAAPGLVAVHCKAGLGRTGTLIALYMMRTMGFRAREAMGWLRVMRPGSVIGEQQHYLCDIERNLLERQGLQGLKLRRKEQPALPRRSAELARPSAVASLLRGLGLLAPSQLSAMPERQPAASAAELAEQLAAGMARRGAARIADAAGRCSHSRKAPPAGQPSRPPPQ